MPFSNSTFWLQLLKTQKKKKKRMKSLTSLKGSWSRSALSPALTTLTSQRKWLKVRKYWWLGIIRVTCCIYMVINPSVTLRWSGISFSHLRCLSEQNFVLWTHCRETLSAIRNPWTHVCFNHYYYYYVCFVSPYWFIVHSHEFKDDFPVISGWKWCTGNTQN